MNIWQRVGSALFGDDAEGVLHRLQVLAGARVRSLFHHWSLIAITSLIALPRLSSAAMATGLVVSAALCIARFVVAARLEQQVARRDLGAARRSEFLLAAWTGTIGLYAAALIAMPPALQAQRQALLVVIAVAVPLVANRSLAASPLNYFALCVPLAIGAIIALASDPVLSNVWVLAAFVLAQAIIVEVALSFLRANRRAVDAMMRERRLVSQQWVLFETSQLGIALTDAGDIARMNARLQAWFAPDGRADTLIAEIAQRTGRTPQRLQKLLQRAELRVQGHAVRSFEFPLVSPAPGTPACIEVQVRRFDPLRPSAGLLWTIGDRSADYRHRHRQSLQNDAQRDALTGVLNRRGLLVRLGQLLSRDLHTRPLAVLCLDLNGFKPLNDKHGHAFGDRVLCTVAQRLQNALRSTDVVARTGGDEFVVLLDPLDDGITAAMVAERLGEMIAVPMLLEGVGCQVQAAIGMAVAPADGADAEPLLRRADTAMYEVKRAVSPQRPRPTSQDSPDPRSRH